MITYIPAQPTLLDDLAWLLRWTADSLVAALRWVGLLPPLDHQPAHYLRAARPEFGADDQYGEEELPELVEQHADDRDFGLLCGDLVPPTEPFTAPDFADATDIAFLAAARRRGQDATDVWSGGLL